MHERFPGINSLIRKIKGDNPKPNPDSSKLFRFSNEEFTPTYGYQDYLDLKALEREDARSAMVLGKLRDASKQTRLLARSQKEVDEYEQTQTKFWEVFGEVHSLDQEIHATSRGEQNITFGGLFYNHALQAGGALIAQRLIDSWEGIVRRRRDPETPDYITPFCEMARRVGIGFSLIKINGLSLMDVVSSDKPLPLGQVFSFLAESLIVRTMMKHRRWLADNQTGSWKDVPNIVLNKIDVAVAETYALTMTPPQLYDDDIKAGTSRSQFAQEAKKAHFKIKSYLTRVTQELISPKGKQHQQLIDLLRGYVKQGKVEGAVALHFLLGSSRSAIQNLYRGMIPLENQNPESTSAFITTSIHEYIASLPENEFIQVADDLDPIFKPEQGAAEEGVSFDKEKYRTRALAIFNSSKERSFYVDPEKVDWKNVVPARSLELKINPDNSNEIAVVYGYENEAGESLTILVYVNAKTGKNDWSILESPYQSDVISRRFNSLIAVVNQALDLVVGEIKKPVKPFQVVSYLREELDQPIVEKFKFEKGGREKPLTPIEVVLAGGFTEAVQAASVESKIMLTDEKNFREATSRLSAEDRLIARSKLEAFNLTGEGRIKRLRLSGSDGRPRYSFRIGEMRAILREGEPGGKTRRFEIERIDQRSKSYEEF